MNSDWLAKMAPQNFRFATPKSRSSTTPPLTPALYTIARRNGEERYGKLSSSPPLFASIAPRPLSTATCPSTIPANVHALTATPTAKSRTIMVRLISMAMTGYYRTMQRPRAHQPLSMLKYDPIGTTPIAPSLPHKRAPTCLDEANLNPTIKRAGHEMAGAVPGRHSCNVTADKMQCENKYFSWKRNAARNNPATIHEASAYNTVTSAGRGTYQWKVAIDGSWRSTTSQGTRLDRHNAHSVADHGTLRDSHDCTHMYYTVSMTRRYIPFRAINRHSVCESRLALLLPFQ